MQCAACGTTNVEAAHFCQQCGKALRAVSESLVGKEVGNYRVEAVMSEGGMGRVYRAEHMKLKRPVCIKTVHAHLAHQPDFAGRFEREAEILATLRHPNIVSTLDVGVTGDGQAYLVMEFIEGESLKELIKRDAPVPPARAAMLIAQVLSALDEAHQHGIVHRDLKPANVLVSKLRDGSEVVKLVDFGIAKVQRPDEAQQALPGITRTGVMIGTPGYMSPEQILSKDVDARADIYAVGLLLYELIEGVRLFRSADEFEAMRMHLVEPVPPVRVASLISVLKRALAKSPVERFPSARAMRETMLAALGHPGALVVAARPSAPPAPSGPRREPPALTAATRALTPARSAAPVDPLEELMGLARDCITAAVQKRAALVKQFEAKAFDFFTTADAATVATALARLEEPKWSRSTQGAAVNALFRGALAERLLGLVRQLTDSGKDAARDGVLRLAGPGAVQRLAGQLDGADDWRPVVGRAMLVAAGSFAGLSPHLKALGAGGLAVLVSVADVWPAAELTQLLKAGLTNTDPKVREQVLRALPPHLALAQAPELRKRLGDKDKAVRIAAVIQVGLIEDAAAVALLTPLAQREGVAADELTELYTALGAIGGPVASKFLIDELSRQKSVELRCVIAGALGQVGDAAARAALEENSKRLLQWPAVREACLRAIERHRQLARAKAQR